MAETGIPIDQLPSTSNPNIAHALPAMFQGLTVQLSIQQIKNLIFNGLLKLQGEWSNAINYAEGAIVSYADGEGALHLFGSKIANNLNNEPDVVTPGDTTEWMYLGQTAIGPEGQPGAAIVTGTSDTSRSIGLGSKAFVMNEMTERSWVNGTRLRFASDASPDTHWMEGAITSLTYPNVTINVDLVGAGVGDTRDDWSAGLAGEPSSVPGPNIGYLMAFESGTTAPPSAGAVRFNNADLSAATKAYISKVNREGSSIALRLAEMHNVARTVKDVIVFIDPATDEQVSFRILNLTDQSGYVEFDIDNHDGETTLPVGEISMFADRAGNDGTSTGDVTAGSNLTNNALVVGEGGAKGIKTVQATATSIYGRAANSAGVHADISAEANDRLLARVSDVISFVQLTYAMIASAAIASVSELRSAAASKLMTMAALISANASVALTDAATIAINFASGWNFHVAAVAGNRALGLPTNIKKQNGIIELTASGAQRTITLASGWQDPDAIFPIDVASGTTAYVSYFVNNAGQPVVAGVVGAV